MIPQQKGLKLFESGKFKRSVLLRGLHAHLSQKDIEKKVFFFSIAPILFLYYELSVCLLILNYNRGHPFKTSACIRWEGVSTCADDRTSSYIRVKNPLHKHFAGMPMVGG